jgi:excisionase family DNA binding protein
MEPKSVAVSRVVTRVPKTSVVTSTSGAAALETAFLAFLQSKTSTAIVPVERRIFLTIAEAAEYTGLPAGFLRKLRASGQLKALKTGAGLRFRRTDLDGLASLADAPATKDELDDHMLRDLELNRRRRQGLPA